MSEEVQKSTAGQGLGIGSLILGIVGLIVAFIPCFGWFALLFSLVGIVLGFIGLSQAKKGNGKKGLNIAGIVLSVLATILVVVWVVLFASAASTLEDLSQDPEFQQNMQNFADEMEEAVDEAQEAADEAEESVE